MFFSSISGILSLSISSCEYSPDEINFVKKGSTITNHLIIDLDSLTSDTLLILQRTTLSFGVDVAEGETFHAAIEIVSSETIISGFTQQHRNFSFLVDPMHHESGVYEMKVTITSGTGTGTLKEHVGAETLVASFSKFLVFDNHPGEKMSITSVQEEDGSVIIRWPEYPHKNLKGITLWRFTDHTYGTEAKSFVVSPHRTFYKDSSFAGETAKYQLQMEVYGGDIAFGPKFSFAGRSSPRIASFQSLPGTTSLEIRWNRFQYPANFQNYKIFESGNPTPLHTVTAITDTIYTLTNYLKFGEHKNIYVVTETHGGRSIQISMVAVHLGEKTPVNNYKRLFFSNDAHRVYSYTPDWLGVWHDNILTDRVSVAYAYTSPFQVMIPHDGSSLFVNDGGLAEYDHVNLTFKKHTFNYFCMTPKVTNDKLMIYSIKDMFNCYPDPNRPPGITLYDYTKNLTVDTLTSYPNVATAPAITFTELGYDERTVLVKNEQEFRLATFDQTHFITDEYIGIPISFEAHFLPMDIDKIYGFSSTQTMVYSISTGQLTVNSLGETIILPELDQVSGWIGGLNTSHTKYMIFDVTTGQKVREIDIAPTQDYYPDYNDPSTLYLWAKKLYLKPGFVLMLE